MNKFVALASALSFSFTAAFAADAPDSAKTSAEALLQSNCLGCHLPQEGGLSRISQQRKSPEGWEMTIARMQIMHGLQLHGPEGMSKRDITHQLVKYLADTQGLAPAETDGVRYLLEQDLNQVESFDEELTQMCGRCHSAARVALQRRPEQEWHYLVDFHIGQFPSIEYSLYGRDREWLSIAHNTMVPRLAADYPLQSDSWQRWQELKKPQLTGSWLLEGYIPGKGEFIATLKTSSDQTDYYTLDISGQYRSGETFSGTGSAVVYSGHEWRASLNFGDIQLRQVLSAAADGNFLSGRQYISGQAALGSQITAQRDTGKAMLMAAAPSAIAAGSSAEITLMGGNLSGSPTAGRGISGVEVVSSDANKMVVRVTAEAGFHGQSALAIGDQNISLAIYNSVDALTIEPAYATARIGGNGGATPKVQAAFRALGVDYGADGEPGTADDLNLGYVDGVNWRAVPRDETAANDQDVKFAGEMDSATGIYTPADAGPNPERYRSTNNAGNLNVEASLTGSEATGSGRLLVTVQRWNQPPLQ